MSNDKKPTAVADVTSDVLKSFRNTALLSVSTCATSLATGAVKMAAEKAYDLGKYHGMVDANLVAIAMVSGGKDPKLSGPSVDTLSDEICWAKEKSFAAGMQRARDLLAAHADETEALARGQAHEAEVAAAHAAEMQTRAAASATRAAVQRAQVALLDREIAALKGEGK